MEISIDDIKKRSDPYQLFLDAINSPETARKYKKALETFLKVVPTKLYKDTIGKKPKNQKPETLADAFVTLSKKDPELASDIIATYIKEDKKRVDNGEISSQTIPNHTKPIKVLLDANRVPIHWKSLNKMLPRREASSNDRAYTRAELQKMIEVAPDITDNLIIQLFSSGGFRLESWNYFTWNDYIPFKNKDGSYKGGALLVYRGDPESYWTFITPEACKTLELYREKWKSDIGVYPKPDDPLLKAVKYPTIHRLNSKGVRKRVDKIVTSIGLRPPLPPGKKRHQVQLDHGFRKYFNTMLRRAKVDYLDKEDMMGHKVGLEKHYERYQEEDFERFPEYQKAILFLTISDEERLLIENQQKQKELDDLEKNSVTFQEINKRLDDVENGIEARKKKYFEIMYKTRNNVLYQVIALMHKILFEISAPEDKKRKMWKEIQDAVKNGKEIDFSPLGDPKELSLDNLKSSLLETKLEQ